MKKILLILCLLFAVNIVFSSSPAFAKVKINTIVTKFPVSGTPVKMYNGKVLLYGITNFYGNKAKPNIIFNSYDNTFKITKFFNNSLTPVSLGNNAVLLNNGKVLFAAPRMFYPSLHTMLQIEKTLKSKLSKEEKETLKASLNEKGFGEWEKIILPQIEKYPELYEKYQKDIKYYNSSIYAQLYDPKTEQFERAGRLNIRRENFIITKAKNGKVYIFGGQAKHTGDAAVDLTRAERAKAVEEYDPKTNLFKIVGELKYETKYGMSHEYFRAFPLDCGKIFLAWSIEDKLHYTFFNPEDNSFEEYKTYDNTFLDMVKLKDERILFFTKKNQKTPPEDIKYWADRKAIEKYGEKWANELYLNIVIYDPKKDDFSKAGNITVPRWRHAKPLILALNDGRVLIAGGTDYVSPRIQFPILSIEIYDPNTQKSTVQGDLPAELTSTLSGIVLDDGRVLIYKSLFVKQFGKLYLQEIPLKVIILTPDKI